jgi:hypothetical protein
MPILYDKQIFLPLRQDFFYLSANQKAVCFSIVQKAGTIADRRVYTGMDVD